MSKATSAIPDGYYSITPYITVHDGHAALDFYQRAFGATVVLTMPDEAGKIAHAEIQLGNSRVMLSDEFPAWGAISPHTLKGRTSTLMFYVEDVDAVVAQAVAAGGRLDRPVADQFYGDRVGSVSDPFGHSWHIATHLEDLTEAELQERMKTWSTENP
ncbi:glyoxalase [Chitinimonas prasina]|uniref:Glyoxalase n=1 Tax=Chitinimonas prasina TaxID=1434937 RepID=A0ABQ5YHM4_9NEIS|nr:VOC family protein [Chitinimonas prasina]GLR13444.1 glyoxalase [Chitinimonas prasina]